MPFCFVHAADLHLDTPFQGIAQDSPGAVQMLQDASLQALDRLVDLTLSRQAAFLLLAGDIYDGLERGVRAQLRFRDALARLSQADIPTFIVHGNHDPVGGWSAIRKWPTGVTVFGPHEVQAVTAQRNGEPLATIYGISYDRPDVTDNLAQRSGQPGPGLHVGLLHCSLGSAEHAPYSPCSVGDLAAVGMDYWALGHVHRHQVMREGQPHIVYPGNLQGRSPHSSELGAKGACVVSVDGSRIRGVELVPVDVVRFVLLEVAVEDLPDLTAVRDALLGRLDDLRAEHAGRNLVVRAKLTGRSTVHRDLAQAGVAADLLKFLREAAKPMAPKVWWESLVDLTQAPLDWQAIRQRGDFAADLLNASDAVAADPQELAAFSAKAWEMLEGPSLRPTLASLEPPSVKDLLEQAHRLALDLLDTQENPP